MSNVRLQISDLIFWIPDFKFQIPDFRFHISDLRFQISDFRFRNSDARGTELLRPGEPLAGSWGNPAGRGAAPALLRNCIRTLYKSLGGIPS